GMVGILELVSRGRVNWHCDCPCGRIGAIARMEGECGGVFGVGHGSFLNGGEVQNSRCSRPGSHKNPCNIWDFSAKRGGGVQERGGKEKLIQTPSYWWGVHRAYRSWRCRAGARRFW